MTALPVNSWSRTCAECDEARLVSVQLVLNEDETAYDEIPTFLEDTGNPEDLLKAKQIALGHYSKKIIKTTGDEKDAISYEALINDLKT